MPIYEYQCNKCGNVFEVLQKFSDPPIKKHEKCGGKVEKLISKSGFQLKGGGWFASGYAKEAPAKAESTTESKSSESKSSDSKPSESKSTESKPSETKASETKTEAKPAAKAKKD